MLTKGYHSWLFESCMSNVFLKKISNEFDTKTNTFDVNVNQMINCNKIQHFDMQMHLNPNLV